MDIMYDPTCLEHYGVGHDKGGHSGRYPWGSGAKNKYIKQVRSKITKANRTKTEDLTHPFRPSMQKVHDKEIKSIEILSGTQILANSTEVQASYLDLKRAENEYSETVHSIMSIYKKDKKFRLDRFNEIYGDMPESEMKDHVRASYEMAEIDGLFMDWLVQKSNIKAWTKFDSAVKKLNAAEAVYTQTIVDQLVNEDFQPLATINGADYFWGLSEIQTALTKTLDKMSEKNHIDEILDDKDKKGGKA